MYKQHFFILNASIPYSQYKLTQQRQMRIALKDIVLLFEKIQQQMNIDYVSIVIFTALDLDSLCALKILTKLFRAEHIDYKVYPVGSYSQLYARIEDSKCYQKCKLFTFINCGGIVDLTQHWITQDSPAQIFLFDVNKPIHHHNIAHQQIKVIDDGSGQFDACPTIKDFKQFQDLNQYDLQFSDQEYGQEGSDRQDDDGSPKRPNKRRFKQKLRKHKDAIEQKINSYYSRHFYSFPSSYSAYRMVRQLNKANNDYLWYAIVGMTSMFLQHKLPKDIMEQLTSTYRAQVAKFNAHSSKQQKGDIANRKGYLFTLLDHWSLYESMRYSDYLMTKLGLWEDKGLNRLHQLIHALGISLQQAKQLYKFMKQDSQHKLQNSIIPAAQKFSLLDVTYMSFMRQLDFAASFMASDYYYMLSAALQAPPPNEIPFEKQHQYRVKCFWQAYDVFDGGLAQLNQRIEQYKGMTKVLMGEARSILQRQHLILMKKVSVANIRSDTQDRKLFQHPSALVRMAYLLMGIVRQRRKAEKPFIASWIDMKNDVCVVTGVMADSKNTIGTKFTEIAEKLNLQINQDSFMANLIIIQKDSLGEFLKKCNQD